MKNITDWFVVINTFLLMLYKTITNRFINFNQKIASSQLDNIIMVTNCHILWQQCLNSKGIKYFDYTIRFWVAAQDRPKKGQLTNSLTLTVGQQAILIVLSNVKLIAWMLLNNEAPAEEESVRFGGTSSLTLQV